MVGPERVWGMDGQVQKLSVQEATPNFELPHASKRVGRVVGGGQGRVRSGLAYRSGQGSTAGSINSGGHT